LWAKKIVQAVDDLKIEMAPSNDGFDLPFDSNSTEQARQPAINLYEKTGATRSKKGLKARKDAVATF
jgi:hypothetical protein